MKTTAALLLTTSLSLSTVACGDPTHWDGDGWADGGAADGGTDGEDDGVGGGDGGGGAGDGGGDGTGAEEDDDLRACEDGECEGDDDDPRGVIVVPGDGGGELECRPAEVPLVAGQHFEAGVVEVTTTEDGLLVEVGTLDEWTMHQVHVTAGVDVPGTNPGAYPWSEMLDYAADFGVEIPFDALEAQCGDVLVVAVHAVVSKPVDGEEECMVDTAWGKGEHTFDVGWGSYFEVTLCCD